jgi:hypothetical protein
VVVVAFVVVAVVVGPAVVEVVDGGPAVVVVAGRGFVWLFVAAVCDRLVDGVRLLRAEAVCSSVPLAVGCSVGWVQVGQEWV